MQSNKDDYSVECLQLIDSIKTDVVKKINHLPNITLPEFIQLSSLKYACDQTEKFNSLMNEILKK